MSTIALCLSAMGLAHLNVDTHRLSETYSTHLRPYTYYCNMDFFTLLLGGVIALATCYYFCIKLPADMAEERGRSSLFWVLVSLAASPLTAIVLLWLLGDSGDKEDACDED